MSRSSTEIHVLRLRATHGDAEALAAWRGHLRAAWIRFPTLHGAALSLGVQRNTLARWIRGDTDLKKEITIQPRGNPALVRAASPTPSPKKDPRP